MVELPESVVEAIESGNTIEAIKRLREATGVDLVTAKSAVELYGKPAGAVEPSTAVHAALAAGRKLEAIKLYREEAGVGLREARIRIEALQAGQQRPATDTTGGLRSMVSMLIAIAVVVGVYYWLTSS